MRNVAVIIRKENRSYRVGICSQRLGADCSNAALSEKRESEDPPRASELLDRFPSSQIQNMIAMQARIAKYIIDVELH